MGVRPIPDRTGLRRCSPHPRQDLEMEEFAYAITDLYLDARDAG
jgi:hypothetical protein